jgi:hypothetical protein
MSNGTGSGPRCEIARSLAVGASAHTSDDLRMRQGIEQPSHDNRRFFDSVRTQGMTCFLAAAVLGVCEGRGESPDCPWRLLRCRATCECNG